MQTQAGYPLVKGDGSGQSTKKVHAYGAQWAELIAEGYEPVTFSNSKWVILAPWTSYSPGLL